MATLLSPVLRFYQIILFPVAKPSALLLDIWLGKESIQFFAENIPNLLEVSIGHALISESLYLGLENVINMYKYKLSLKV